MSRLTFFSTLDILVRERLAIMHKTNLGAHILFKIENLVLRARSEFSGFAGKDCELFLEYWSIGVLEKAKARIPT